MFGAFKLNELKSSKLHEDHGWDCVCVCWRETMISEREFLCVCLCPFVCINKRERERKSAFSACSCVYESERERKRERERT